MPETMMYGTSSSERRSVSSPENSMTSPRYQRLSTVAVTVAMMMGMKLAIAYSIITTSMAKMTPAMGGVEGCTDRGRRPASHQGSHTIVG